MADEQTTTTATTATADSGAGSTPADVNAPAATTSVDADSAAVAAVAGKLTVFSNAEAKDEAAPVEAVSDADAEAETKAEDAPADKPALDWRLKAAADLAGIDPETLKDADERTVKVLTALADKIDAEHKAAIAPPPQVVKDAEKAANAFDPSKPFAFPKAAEGEEDVFTEETRTQILNPIEEYLNGIGKQVAEMMPYHAESKRRSEMAEFQEIEGFFKEHGKDFKDVLGDGPTAGMDENSPQAKARGELYFRAAKLRQMYESEGKPITTTQAMKAALSMLHSDRVKDAHQRELVDKAKKQTARITARPNSARSTTPIRSDEAAIDAVAKKVGEYGIV